MADEITQDITHDAVLATAAKGLPPMTVAGLTLAGVQLSDWVLIVTLVWLLLQIGDFIYKKVKAAYYGYPEHERRKWKKK